MNVRISPKIKNFFKDWKKQLPENLNLKIGRWNIPGNPIAILVDFSTFYKDKDKIYTEIWENFGVDSLHAYGDYDEASMFSYAAARVVESFYHYYIKENQKVIYHGNEWMTCMGLLYLRLHLPQVATILQLTQQASVEVSLETINLSTNI